MTGLKRGQQSPGRLRVRRRISADGGAGRLHGFYRPFTALRRQIRIQSGTAPGLQGDMLQKEPGRRLCRPVTGRPEFIRQRAQAGHIKAATCQTLQCLPVADAGEGAAVIGGVLHPAFALPCQPAA